MVAVPDDDAEPVVPNRDPVLAIVVGMLENEGYDAVQLREVLGNRGLGTIQQSPPAGVELGRVAHRAHEVLRQGEERGRVATWIARQSRLQDACLGLGGGHVVAAQGANEAIKGPEPLQPHGEVLASRRIRLVHEALGVAGLRAAGHLLQVDHAVPLHGRGVRCRVKAVRARRRRDPHERCPQA